MSDWGDILDAVLPGSAGVTDAITGGLSSDAIDSILGGSLSTDSSSTTQTLLDPTQQAYIAEMMLRESELYPYLSDLVSQSGTNAQDVYSTAMDQLSKRFPNILQNLDQAVKLPGTEYASSLQGIQSGGDVIANMIWPTIADMSAAGQGRASMTDALGRQIANYQLSPEADKYLKSIRDERIAGLQTAADQLVGNSVADLNRRGMLSSSTAEGAMGSISKALAPEVAAANADYFNAKLTQPGQNAAQQYAMGSDANNALMNMLNSRFGIASAGGGAIQNTAGQKMNLATSFGNTMQNNLGNEYNMLQNFGATNAAEKSKMYDDPYQKYLSLWQPVATMGNTNQGGTTTTTQQTSPFQTIAAMAPYAAMAYMAA